jgi:carbon monoxide dehydrogenase subunit G
MELKGERRLAVDRATAWKALNDPEVLRACIPGCESVDKTGDNEYTAVVAAALGPVRARFSGKLRLEDVVPPVSYTIRFEGQGGAAGFAKGSSQVSLEEYGPETILRYAVNAQVGGKLAQVGNRLIDSAALKLADDFFAAFERHVGGGPSAAAGAPATERQSAPPGFEPHILKRIAYMAIFVAVVVVGVLIFK